MRAVVLREPGDVRVEEVALAPPKAGEVLVRIAAAGVCHSDVHLADGEPRRRGAGRWCSGTRAPAPSRRSARASCTSRPATASSSA